jgi:DNA polymerase-3 subunit gamma/tau
VPESAPAEPGPEAPDDAAVAAARPAAGDEQTWQSLYRRYRPTRFAQVRGQDHVTLALTHAVRDSKVAHAYLFSGPRGTGKTSTARILAKALNCEAPVDGEPCSHCDSCVAITRGASFDVHELDAASNNGVDAMRDLVARAALSTPGRWKVYIVDEVHMLSTAASNALLKTLEEPPAHVVFVLATTDAQKVLPTIRSRTQHFEFHLINPDLLTTLLGDIAADAHLELPLGAIDVAVRRGKGSARDALSVLDQVAASGITEDESPTVSNLMRAIAERDTGAALVAVAEAIANGRDVQRLAVDLVEQLRRGFLLLAAPEVATRLDATLGALDAQAETVKELGLARCVRAMEVIGTAQVDMRTAADPRVTLEVAVARLTHPEADDSTAAMLERIERLERGGGGGTARPPGGAPAEQPAPPPPPPTRRAPESRAPESRAPESRAPESRAPEASALETGAPEARRAPAPVAAGADRPTFAAFKADRPQVDAQAEVERPAHTEPASRPEPAPATPAGDGTTKPAAGASAGDLRPLNRDDVVAAWGDSVLTALRPKARAMYQAGRFLGVEGSTATFALPNRAHVHNAEAQRAEVAAALALRLGQHVELELVVDPGGGQAGDRAPGTPLSGPPDAADSEGGFTSEEREYIEDLTDPDAESGSLHKGQKDTAVSLATDRLLQAFPGAQEV